MDASDQIFISGGFMGTLKYTDNDSLISTGAFDMFIIKLDEWDANLGQECRNRGESTIIYSPFH